MHIEPHGNYKQKENLIEKRKQRPCTEEYIPREKKRQLWTVVGLAQDIKKKDFLNCTNELVI